MSATTRAAWWCGLLPLIVGCAVFAAWVITRAEVLFAIGLCVVISGTSLALFGMGLLGMNLWRARRDDAARETIWRQSRAPGLLLLANFPIAAMLTVAAVAIETCYTIEFANATAAPVTAIRVTGRHHDLAIADLAPGATARRWMWIRNDDALYIEFAAPDQHQQLLDDYVTPSLGGSVRVTWQDDGTVSVAHR